MESTAPLMAASLNFAALQTLGNAGTRPAAGGTFLSQLNGVKSSFKEKSAAQNKNAPCNSSAKGMGSGLGRHAFAGQNALDGQGLLNEILSAKAQSCALGQAQQEEALQVLQGGALPYALNALQNVAQASLRVNFARASLLLALALVLKAATLAASSPAQGSAEAAYKSALWQLCLGAYPVFCLLCPVCAGKKEQVKKTDDLKKRRKYLLHKFKYGTEPPSEEPLPGV